MIITNLGISPLKLKKNNMLIKLELLDMADWRVIQPSQVFGTYKKNGVIVPEDIPYIGDE